MKHTHMHRNNLENPRPLGNDFQTYMYFSALTATADVAAMKVTRRRLIQINASRFLQETDR